MCVQGRRGDEREDRLPIPKQGPSLRIQVIADLLMLMLVQFCLGLQGFFVQSKSRFMIFAPVLGQSLALRPYLGDPAWQAIRVGHGITGAGNPGEGVAEHTRVERSGSMRPVQRLFLDGGFLCWLV
ncbi:hypothetical protein CCR91_08050 [Thiorhodovibrio winogradskyi]|nr:hypothetical protein [Thiorhodovibrio winogradskyi]